MANRNRDEFTEKTKLQIAKRAGWLCSEPSCRRPTVSATSDRKGEVNIGIAAHICAAAPGGPRHELAQTSQERRSATNGIWLCVNHATIIDKDSKYTVKLLHEWKAQAELDALRRVTHNPPPHGHPIESPTNSEISSRLRSAAASDLDVFRRLDSWPPTAIALTLEVDGLGNSVSASALATALITLDDLILIAPPGMGKTTTLFQIADAVLANGSATPIIIPLGDWSTDNKTLLESVLRRPAFRGISEDDLRAVAAKPGVVLLLDGWNELGTVARNCAESQIQRLQAELPELGFLISTRRQMHDVPVKGKRINLLPLSQKQQLDIAKSLRGDAGVRMVDLAWRTTGVRELVAIPLYLTALLALPEGVPFPTTKEEVLRRFVTVHDAEVDSTDALSGVMHGLHHRFLEDLAVKAARTSNTTIPETEARKSISETLGDLVNEGQITEKPQPNSILGFLVSHHLLIRIGDPAGYSFQHQQFLEWYAAHLVVRVMMASAGDSASQDKLKAEILNQPAWEESTLFACERLSHGDSAQQEACSAAILAAFEVDPMLAAEMIFRSTDAIWLRVNSPISEGIRRWHTAGTVDRALRFMISSGRPEFFNYIWPLITHEDHQISLAALRAGRRFRPSLLGNDATERIAALSPEIRKNVLCEIVSNSGMDGLDLATSVTTYDPDPEVKASVISMLAFRRADRHVVAALLHANDTTFDLLARMDIIDDIHDEHIRTKLEAAFSRTRKEGISNYDRLRKILHAQSDEDLSIELTAIVAEMDVDKSQGAGIRVLHEAHHRYSRAIANGLLQRVRAGRELFYGASDLLASADFSLEDDALLEIALAETKTHDSRAEAAASVLGPNAVGRMIDALLEADMLLRDKVGTSDQVAIDRYNALQARVGHTPRASLISAISARSAHAGNDEIEDLAELIYRHTSSGSERIRPFDADMRAAVGALASDWGTRLLASGDSTRRQLATIALITSRAPSVRLLPLLKQLLDEDLRRFRAFREEAKATGARRGRAIDEARTLHTHEYQLAFNAIDTPETSALMCDYLGDDIFGQCAANVLAAQWTAANEPGDGSAFKFGVDFSRVEEKRIARTIDPTATSAEADAIFGVIDSLISNGSTKEQNSHAVVLGIVAARLPHGRRDITINTLISMAPRRSRAALLQNLILSGEIIDIRMVMSGLAEVFEEAKEKRWVLSEDGYQVKEWLRLLPFASPVSEVSAVVRSLPDDQRRVDQLEELIAGFRTAPGDDAENVLFELAEAYPKFYANHAWRDAAIRRGTLSAAWKVVDLVANGAFESKETDHWHMAKQLGGLIVKHPELRSHAYRLLEGGASTPGLAMLASAVAECPDTDGLLLLIRIEIDHKRSFISWHTIENVVTEHVPSESWEGAYSIVPIPAVELRRKLLAMTTDGGPMDAAARCLKQIDEARDEYGTPDTEPRHPDLASGKRWPIMIR